MSALPVKDVKSAKEATSKVRWAALFVRLILAAIFVWAAVPKLMDPSAFAEAVANYHLVPDSLVGAVAVVVPALELVVAIALVVGMGARGAAIVAGLMLVGFTIGMIQAMARGIDLDCGCFGTATKVEVGWGSIARNVALLGLAVCVAVMPDAKWRGGGPKAGAAVTAALSMLLALSIAGCGGEPSAPREGPQASPGPAPATTPAPSPGARTTIESLGFALDLPPGHEISGTRVTLEPGTRTPRTLEIRKITSDAAQRLVEEIYSAQARIAGGATSLVYRVEQPEDVGSGGPEVHLTGVFRLCEAAYRVECHAQGEPPPDGAWCVRILETMRIDRTTTAGAACPDDAGEDMPPANEAMDRILQERVFAAHVYRGARGPEAVFRYPGWHDPAEADREPVPSEVHVWSTTGWMGRRRVASVDRRCNFPTPCGAHVPLPAEAPDHGVMVVMFPCSDAAHCAPGTTCQPDGRCSAHPHPVVARALPSTDALRRWGWFVEGWSPERWSFDLDGDGEVDAVARQTATTPESSANLLFLRDPERGTWVGPLDTDI